MPSEEDYTTDDSSDDEVGQRNAAGTAARAAAAGPSDTPAHTRKKTTPPRRWQPHEDKLLRAAVKQSGEANWKAIASKVGTRNHVQCLQRWKKVSRAFQFNLMFTGMLLLHAVSLFVCGVAPPKWRPVFRFESFLPYVVDDTPHDPRPCPRHCRWHRHDSSNVEDKEDGRVDDNDVIVRVGAALTPPFNRKTTAVLFPLKVRALALSFSLSPSLFELLILFIRCSWTKNTPPLC